MTREKLEKANIICSEIDRLKANLESWETARGVKSMTLVSANNNRCTQCSINTDFINFENIKALTISKLKKSIKELEAEFERL